MGLGRFFGRDKDEDGGLGIPGADESTAPAVPVTEVTPAPVSLDDPLAGVRDLLHAQGIDLPNLPSGAVVQIESAHMDPAQIAQLRASMLGMFGATAGTAADDGVDDVVTSLERLAKLRDSGVLTAQEFAAQKARILGGR